MPRSERSSWRDFAMCSLGMLAVCSCATAASTGDDVIRKASFGRIQATPFVDHLQTKDCRSSLEATYGFTRESRTMKNGVFVVESFDCRADQIVVEVSINNYTAVPMRCYAESDNGSVEVIVAPKAAGFFEYSYSSQAYQDCWRVD